ncbi:hypothetical protein [Deinococcus koreensis]|uniref:hypothetical protein n=1 Tax=Deinococcus koreensis TaxID=2054903 RepID=UPI0010570C0F|nr:hypothetical protein [Deinococcus koreensis]
MDRHASAALNYLQEASDEDWMCFAWFYLDHFHVRLALWMVNQTRCPEAVALALYWYSQPAVCLNYRRKHNISYWHSERYAVFETVEYWYGAGFYKPSEVGFDPAADLADPVGSLNLPRNWVESLSAEDKVEYRHLTKAVLGRIIEPHVVAADWIEGLPAHLKPLFSYNQN